MLTPCTYPTSHPNPTGTPDPTSHPNPTPDPSSNPTVTFPPFLVGVDTTVLQVPVGSLC